MWSPLRCHYMCQNDTHKSRRVDCICHFTYWHEYHVQLCILRPFGTRNRLLRFHLSLCRMMIDDEDDCLHLLSPRPRRRPNLSQRRVQISLQQILTPRSTWIHGHASYLMVVASASDIILENARAAILADMPTFAPS